MKASRKRVGIMGGTFDPIHIGHLILGETAYEQFQLSKVLFMPAGNPPHKVDRQGRASNEQRVEMVKRAIASNDHFELSLVDMNEEGYSYTYRTLEAMAAEERDTDFYFILGADSLFNFDTWKEPSRICAAAAVIVATRDHTNAQALQKEMDRVRRNYGGRWERLDSLNIDISSQMLRNWVREGRTIRYYIPDEVASYIEAEGLYKDEV